MLFFLKWMLHLLCIDAVYVYIIFMSGKKKKKGNSGTYAVDIGSLIVFNLLCCLQINQKGSPGSSLMNLIFNSNAGRSKVQVLYAARDYRSEGGASASEWMEATVKSSTEIIFQPLNSKKTRKIKLSSIVSVSLSA